jgi:dihydroorotate dehydrogenase
VAIRALELGAPLASVAGRPLQVVDERLAQTLLGIRFPNPVGLGAGFDKYARAVPAWPGIGFGFVEVGTITAHPQPGNDKPRIFRLSEDQALINRLGFNNDGADTTGERLRGFAQAGTLNRIPIGVNIGKSKVTPLEEAVGDYVASFDRLAGYADYLVVNVSSPNTPGLRQLQDRDQLSEIVRALKTRQVAGRPPILVKIAPDLTDEQLADVVSLADELDLDGLVVSNTTLSRDGLRSVHAGEAGGLSGAPLRERSLSMLREVRRTVGNRRLIIGVGGIFTADDAWTRIAAGAGLVQIYTGFVYGGPGTVAEINRGLLERMQREGVGSIGELVGTET